MLHRARTGLSDCIGCALIATATTLVSCGTPAVQQRTEDLGSPAVSDLARTDGPLIFSHLKDEYARIDESADDWDTEKFHVAADESLKTILSAYNNALSAESARKLVTAD